MLEPEELEEIKLESSRAIELAQFVDRAEIDPRYFEKPYYVAPEGDVSTEGFIVIREALTSTGKVGLGKLTMHGRENLVAVMPFGKGLILETLRYQNELRAANPNFADIPDLKIDKEMIELATELIRRKSRPFDPAQNQGRLRRSIETVGGAQASRPRNYRDGRRGKARAGQDHQSHRGP